MKQNKDKKIMPSIGVLAFTRYKQRFGYSLPITVGFTILALSFLLMGVFFPYTLWFIVPFVILPLFLAFTISLCDGHKSHELSNRMTLAYFLSYFHAPFYGSYRVVWNFVSSLFLTLPLEVALYFSLVPVFRANYPSFGEDLSTLYSLFHVRDYSSALTLIQNEEGLFSFVNLFTLLSSTFFLIIFLFRISGYALNPFLHAHMGQGPSRIVNHIFVGGLKNAKKGYLRDYYSSLWWMLLLFFSFFALGIMIGWFFLPNAISPLGIVTLGVMFGLVATSPFLPYYIWVLDLLFKKYCYSFLDYSISLAEDALSAMEKEKDISEEEKQEIKDQVMESKKARKDILDHLDHFYDEGDDDGKED